MSSDDAPFSCVFPTTVRLFPVPNLVMFPHVIQPLHVFEPRYRELTVEAIAGDGLIAMPVLCPGWEKDYEGRPALRPVACLGRILTHHRQSDGRFNLLLVGLTRIQLTRELPPARLFRQAEAELIRDHEPCGSHEETAALAGQLLGHFETALSRMAEVRENLDHLLRDRVPLGTLTDIIGHTLRLPLALKEQLLSEADVFIRARLLLKQLDPPALAAAAESERFPPGFSAN